MTWVRPQRKDGRRAIDAEIEATSPSNPRKVTETRTDTWAGSRRLSLRGFGRHQLSVELVQMEEEQEAREAEEGRGSGNRRVRGSRGGRNSSQVAPLSLLEEASNPRSSGGGGGGGKGGRKNLAVVTRRLMSKKKLTFAEAVKMKGLGRAIAELPSTVKMVAAFKKFGQILARPFSKDKYLRNTGKQRDRVKARHGPLV